MNLNLNNPNEDDELTSPESEEVNEETGEGQSLPLNEIFGQRLRFIRTSYLYKSQQELADAVGFTPKGQATIHNFEKGNGSASNFCILLRYLDGQGVNINYLFTENPTNIPLENIRRSQENPLFMQRITDLISNVEGDLAILRTEVNNSFNKATQRIYTHKNELGLAGENTGQ